MKIVGRFEDGKVVFDSPPQFADGSVVDVQLSDSPSDANPVALEANETAEEWITRLKDWVATLPVRNIEIDDSRESIYD